MWTKRLPSPRTCLGTTKSGGRCRNTIKFDPTSPETVERWRDGRCGRCSGPVVEARDAAWVSTRSLLREGRINELSPASEEEQREAIGIAFLEIRDAAWARIVGSDSSKLHHVQDYGSMSLPITGSEIEAILSLAPLEDESDLAQATHVRMLQEFEILQETTDGVERTPDVFHRIVQTTNSLDVLAAAAEQGFYTLSHRHTPHRQLDATAEARLAVVDRLGDLYTSQPPEGAAVGSRDGARELLAGILAVDYYRSRMVKKILDLAHAVDNQQAGTSDFVTEGTHQEALWAMDALLSVYRERHDPMGKSVAECLLQSPHCPRTILAAEVWDRAHAKVVRDHPNSTDEIRELAKRTLSARRSKMVGYDEPRRCGRYTNSNTQCGNTFRKGKASDWCGRCAGRPATLVRGIQHDAAGRASIGLPDDYIPLDYPRREAEGWRWAHLRATLDRDSRETQEQLQDRLRALRAGTTGDHRRILLDVADSSRLTEACAAVGLFTSDDKTRPALMCVGLPNMGGRRVVAATDSYSAAIDFGTDGIVSSEQPHGTSLTPVVHPSVLEFLGRGDTALTGIHVDGERMLYETSKNGQSSLNRNHQACAFPNISVLVEQGRGMDMLPVNLETGRLEDEFESGAHIEVSVQDLERLVKRVDAEERSRHKEHKPSKWVTRAAGVVFGVSAHGAPSIKGVCSRHDVEHQFHYLDDPVPLGDYRTRMPAGNASDTCISTMYANKIIKAAKQRGSQALKFGIRHRSTGAEFRSPVWCQIADGLSACVMPVRLK